jgi:hypothetical protein
MCTCDACLALLALAIASYPPEFEPEVTTFATTEFWVPNHRTWMCAKHRAKFSKFSQYYDDYKSERIQWQPLTTTTNLRPTASIQPEPAATPSQPVPQTSHAPIRPTYGRELKEERFWVVTIAGLLEDASIQQCIE